jgi:hypothetical protein
MEDLAHLDAAGHEIVARGLDVGDDQVERLGRARRCRRDVRAELDRAPGATWRELDEPEGGARDVGVEAPAEPAVELLRAIDIRDGDDDHLELHLEVLDGRGHAQPPGWCQEYHRASAVVSRRWAALAAPWCFPLAVLGRLPPCLTSM